MKSKSLTQITTYHTTQYYFQSYIKKKPNKKLQFNNKYFPRYIITENYY